MSASMPYDTILIGAGMSGLAAGIRLAQFDQRVLVLDRHYLWGGLNSDRKSTRLNSSHVVISYAVFCLKKKTYIASLLSPLPPP